ncbi:DUF6263 family protein [Gilvibacter sediminis]|uniref:DUF6263 family protein n=1 Tax=Gilvibacter sediminis TaxID=379071 RepID=UPI00235082DE|nr:DUF6263 family protein [Gilvibacter sediminis]MDC7999050.1 DUF6263 family protein [Gilvibacter sediminis]
MKFFKTTLFFLLISAATAFGQQKLGYNLKKGDQFNLTQKSLQTIKQSITGMNIELVNDIQAEFLLTVVDVTKDSYMIEFEFTNFAYEMRSETMGPMLSVDTANEEYDETDITQTIFRGLLNVPMTFEMLKTGRIIDITGGDALIDNMLKKSGIEDEMQLAAMRQGMEKEYGGQKIAAGFEQFTYIYPESKKTKGDTWKTEIDGDLKAQHVWTLESFNRNIVNIAGTAEIQMNIDSGTTKIQCEGTQTTQIVVDSAHGFITSYHSESTADGESFAEALGDEAIPTSITTITDYTINK